VAKVAAALVLLGAAALLFFFVEGWRRQEFWAGWVDGTQRLMGRKACCENKEKREISCRVVGPKEGYVQENNFWNFAYCKRGLNQIICCWNFKLKFKGTWKLQTKVFKPLPKQKLRIWFKNSNLNQRHKPKRFKLNWCKVLRYNKSFKFFWMILREVKINKLFENIHNSNE
jgi:hypothetical protein